MANERVADHPIDLQFLRRWSPRAFTGEPIDDNLLLSFFEAARWAPSSFNSQPWRFVYAKNDSPRWAEFVGLLSEFNQAWAQNASALVVVASKKTFTPPGQQNSINMASHSFDTGAAWAYLALQASLSGWASHGIGGFDKEKARQLLAIPDEYTVEAVIAIGRQADKGILPESLQAREEPSLRNPVSAFAAAGRFEFGD